MAKILGIGGIFFKSKDPGKLGDWYRKWLNLEIDDSFGGSVFQPSGYPKSGYTLWSPFKEATDYFDPTKSAYMINFIVDDLHGALKQVEAGGGELIGEPEDGEFGKFGWFLDPDGNKVELWQP